MKVTDLRDKVTAWENEGKIKDQTIEFVIASKKHFISDLKCGANTLTFDVTRGQYTPLTINALKSSLATASGDTEVKVTQNGAEKVIEDLYLSDDFLEFILA